MLLARLELQLRNHEQAHDAVQRVLQLRPDEPLALYTLGRVQKALGRLEDAERSYRRVLEIRPDDPDALTSLGIVLRLRGHTQDAIGLYRRALAVVPSHREAGINLGNALEALGASAEAKSHRERSLPGLLAEAGSLRERAARLVEQGDLANALGLLKSALRLAPDAADIWMRAGMLAFEMGALPESLPYLEQASRLDPGSALAVSLALRVCVAGGLSTQAGQLCQRAYELTRAPDYLVAGKLVIPAILPSTEAVRTIRSAYEAGLDAALAETTRLEDPYNNLQLPAFYLAYHGECDRDLQAKAARMYLQRIPDLQFTAAHCRQRTQRPGRIRIGFLSRFLCAHSIGKTTRGLIEKLRRDRFEVYVLRVMPSAEDEVTRQICAAADHVLALDPSVPRARVQIAALELDVLFYQDIGLEPTSFFLAFARLAPVQCVSFGHPDTTGIPNMDYFISNDLYELPGAGAHYSERLLLLHDLPTLAYYYRPPLPVAAAGRPKFGLPERGTIYLCPQTLFKLHPELDELIRQILERDANGLLVLIAGLFPQWSEMLRLRFAHTLGDVAQRIVFLPAMRLEDFLELLSIADVVLDPIHFNGMNSSLESFAVGTPVVTLPTQLQRGRHTQAMYRKMGLTECIADSREQYVEIALRLGTDRDYAREVREQIRARSEVLFEDPRVVAEFERCFEEMVAERGWSDSG
jgi:protein O-GlcNAc transferase